MKKITVVLAVLLMLSASLFAQGANEASSASKTITVGICQFVQHPALDAATQGFMDAITKAMGDSVKFDNQNASAEITNCATIINGFVSKNVNLIMANATPPLQAAASATNTIPVLGTSVTDYATALEIDAAKWNGTVGTNVSGTSDLAPLSEQAKMIKELFPSAKKVALLYCSAEANSAYQIGEVEKYLKDMGVATERFAFTDTN
ncbi:MAG: sugar ABC transporter substrate-binding protein, partial [Spirochaetales bacterium]|nr:sugar ABC transporter substrate-binding protein [Candidatus Physcosoma equi]